MSSSVFSRLLVSFMALSLTTVIFAARTATAESTGLFTDQVIRGYEFVGPYGQFGFSIGQVNFDDIGPLDVDSEASGGFTLTGGYRFLPWLSAEANFSFLGGNDNVEIGNRDFDSQLWSFFFGPKFYPLGLLEDPGLPDAVQPYALVQIGGGEGEIDDVGDEEDSFVARFILGFDIWMTDNVGLFVEGGGWVVEEDAIDGAGIFTFGGQYRF